MKRRTFLASPLALTTASSAADKAASTRTGVMNKRPIPSSGEQVGVIGLGTWQTFDVGLSAAEAETLGAVLDALVEGGGSVVDSSPMYGRSESVVGTLARQRNLTDKLFMATKVWTNGRQAGIDQMQRSFERMGVEQMNLMQVHNLRDAEVHLDTLQQWQENGKLQYTGITHYHAGGYAAMIDLMERYPIDFIQINYSLLSRGVEREILPLAQERKIAVLINRPYEGGDLFSRVRGQSLPEWAAEFDCDSWGQFFLKFILANEAVTCVIPGTSKLRHLRDNLAAGSGRLPTADHREKMQRLFS